MKDKLQTIAGFIVLLLPVAAYIYTMYLSITMFLIPAFKLYFDMYGIFGTFAIWAGLSFAGYMCGYTFMKIWTYKPPQATYKETNS